MLYIIRHGLTDWNVLHKLLPWTVDKLRPQTLIRKQKEKRVKSLLPSTLPT